MTYISWCWQKSGNDGRRPSGRVVKRGVWHIAADPVPKTKDEAERATTLCGRAVNLHPSIQKEVPDHVCARCLKAAQRKGQQ